MSIQEYIAILASWEYTRRTKQFNCLERYKKIKDDKVLEDFKNRNGCEWRTTKEVRYKVDNVNFHNCFCNHLHPNFNYLLFLFQKYQDGFLPFQGSLSDQPSQIIDIFNILERKKQEMENDALEQHKKEMNRNR